MTSTPVLETLAQLVRINSVNPAYESGRSESGINSFIARFFQERGVATTLQEVFPDRQNLIAIVPGRSRTARVILEAHVDTASVTGMSIAPFHPVIESGKLYGRGSCDTKAGAAAMMHAVAAIAEDGIRPPCEIWFVAAVDEEHAFGGVTKLCENLEAKAAIVSEPTDLRVVVATKGVLRWRICCRGKAAHSSKPHLGVNAIVKMARIIDAIERHSRTLATQEHPLLGPATCNIGVVKGGVQVNFVPDFCAIEIDRRLLPGEEFASVLAEYEGLLATLRARDPGLDVYMEPPMLQDLPLETRADSGVVSTAVSVARQLGLMPEPSGVPYGSDASKLSRAGIPSIVFGPGSIDQAHAAVEYVECSQVERAVEFYRQFILRFE